VQFFGFAFDDDTTFYRLIVNKNWEPETEYLGGEEYTTEPDLSEATESIQSQIPFTNVIMIGVCDPDDKVYFMLAVASSVNNEPVEKTLSKQQLDHIASVAHFEPGTARWMRSVSNLSELKELGVPQV
jgi:hypothetical protein